MNLMIGTSSNNTGVVKANAHGIDGITLKKAPVDGGQHMFTPLLLAIWDTLVIRQLVGMMLPITGYLAKLVRIYIGSLKGDGSTVFMAPSNAAYVELTPIYFSQTFPTDTSVSWTHEKLELGTSASPWSLTQLILNTIPTPSQFIMVALILLSQLLRQLCMLITAF